jgi:spermidine/putrescine-binding protein
MKPSRLALAAVALVIATTSFAQDNKLRLLTWADYVQEGNRNRCRSHALE